MMKSYLRYEPKKTFGIISSPQCNVVYDFTGNLAITGAVQDVNVWNLRQASQIATLTSDSANYPYKVSSEVTILEKSPDKVSVASGYADGEVRIYQYINKTLSASLKGHRSAVTSLCFNADGTVLVSGGADSDIILWDLVTHTGICKLRGHKDAVTGVGLLWRGSQQLVVSVSKDTLLKVWDVETRACVQTVVGHRCEIWTLAVSPARISTNESGEQESSVSVVTGTSDEFIRGYRLKGSGTAPPKQQQSVADGELEVLEYYGSVVRCSASDKCAALHFNSTGSLLAAQSSGKVVEVFRVRDDADTRRKTKRRLKRIREKTASSSVKSEGQEVETAMEVSAAAGNAHSTSATLMDELELLHTLRCGARVRGFAFSPVPQAGGAVKAMVGLLSNSLEIYSLAVPPSRGDGEESAVLEAPAKVSVVDMHGHRSDVRGISVSGDGLTLATCSNEGVKTWSAKTNLCVSNCAVEGYCLSMCYAPGGRYIVVGTKDGKLQILDTASGESVFEDVEAHAGAVWSIAVRPDGKGFMSGGADKLVKFWDFTVSDKGLGAVLSRHLVMAHDVLCVRYSPNKSADRLLVAVGLLDNTVKLFYDDSLKFFLSLYGHKLPVMCLDMSYDSAILVSGSADKTIKIWGLDFGDCHRSLVAHEDSVTCLRFQPNTHYFFSAGKDGMVKYWDADRFEQILFFPGHKGSVWGLELSPDGAVCYSVGQDRSVRVWERGEDLVFVEEERERALEAQVDRAAEGEGAGYLLLGSDVSGINGESASSAAALKSVESVKGGEQLMEALDLVEAELADMAEYDALAAAAASERSGSGAEEKQGQRKQTRNSNPLMLGLSPYKYMVRALRNVKAPDLEQALILLPFSYVTRLISMLIELVKRALDLELCTRCAIFLLHCHLPQILSTQSLLTEMLALKDILTGSINEYRELVGANVAGLRFSQRLLEERKEDGLLASANFDMPLPPVNKSSTKKGKKRAKHV